MAALRRSGSYHNLRYIHGYVGLFSNRHNQDFPAQLQGHHCHHNLRDAPYLWTFRVQWSGNSEDGCPYFHEPIFTLQFLCSVHDVSLYTKYGLPRWYVIIKKGTKFWGYSWERKVENNEWVLLDWNDGPDHNRRWRWRQNQHQRWWHGGTINISWPYYKK